MSDQLTKNKVDPADKYLSNSVQFPSQLKHIVRFGAASNGVMQELEIPENLQNHFWVSKLRDAVHMHPPTPSRATVSKQSFAILLEVFSDNPNPNMRQFGSLYVKAAKSRIKGSPKTVSDKARTLFCQLANISSDFDLQMQIKEFAGTFKGRGYHQKNYGTWPKISEEYKPRKSLEQRVDLDSDMDATNELFAESFTQFIYCYLKKWSDLRSKLRQDHADLYADLISFIEEHGVETTKQFEGIKSAGSAESKFNSDEMKSYKRLWKLYFEIIENLNDDFIGLNAWAGSNSSKLFEQHIMTSCDLKNISMSYLAVFRAPDSSQYPWKRKVYTKHHRREHIFPNLSFSLLDFVRPCKEEIMCIYWLLGFMRIQKSNVGKLLNEEVYDTIIHHKNCHSVYSYKGRNKDAEPIPLLKNSPLGRSLSIFRSERNPENPPFPMEQFFGDYFAGKVQSAAFKLQGTRNFGFFLFDIDRNSIGFNNISDENFEFLKTIFKKYYRAPEGEHTSLAPAFFAQTKVYEDLTNIEAKITKKPDLSIPLNTPDRFEEEINAKRQFHTLETRESVYLSRSKSKAKLKVGEQLSVAMSNEMHATVNELLEAKQRKTSVLSFTEIQKVIGLSDSETEASPEAILAAAQAQDYIVQRNGLITKNGQTYIFDCGLVARFMIEARVHIESNDGKGLEDVFLSQGRTRGLNIWAEYILLDYLIEHVLSPTSIQSAMTDYAYLEGKVPFVPLTEGGVL